jgi:hypothetical protein
MQNAIKLLPCAVRNALTEFASTRIGFGSIYLSFSSEAINACAFDLQSSCESNA